MARVHRPPDGAIQPLDSVELCQSKSIKVSNGYLADGLDDATNTLGVAFKTRFLGVGQVCACTIVRVY